MEKTVFYEEFEPIYFYSGSSQNWYMRDYHYHKSYEIILFMSEGASLQIGNRLYTASVGDLFLINDAEYHKTIGGKNIKYNRYVLMFYPELFKPAEQILGVPLMRFFEDRPDNFNHKINLRGKNLSDILEIFKKIDVFYSVKEDFNKAYVNIAIMELLLHLQSLYGFFASDQTNLSLEASMESLEAGDAIFKESSRSRSRIEEIKAYVCDNIGEKLTVEDIARKFYMNKYYLSHYFKRATSFNLSEYIKMQKVATAKSLLKKGNSVTDVALLLGYKSDSHFINSFKQVTGTTPKKYAIEKRNQLNVSSAESATV